MKNILSAFVKYPFYGKIVVIILVTIGLYATIAMRKATFPIVESKTITVSVTYQGATPKEMEEGVTTLIEDAIRGIPGIKEFSSSSRENIATVSIIALSNYNIDELLTDVKNSVDGISNFPASAEKPIVSKGRAKDMAMFLSLTYDDDDLIQINKIANRIEDDFLNSGVISQVTIFGFPSRLELSVEVNEEQLRRYKISITDIQSAIASNNLDIQGGKIKNPREEITVLARNRNVSEADISNIVIKAGENGNIVKVGDVAHVTLKFEETPNSSYIDGRRNITFMIQKLENEDLEEISDYVHSYIKDFNASHPKAHLTILHDFLKVIDGQLKILVTNGIQGVILVILCLSLMLNFRLSLWVAWGIPASFLGMFTIANSMGFTLNIISLFGMILIIGILVDDGIVIGENIFTHYEKGKSPRRSAIEGTLEVLPAVIASVTTTMVAFVPLFFIEGGLEVMYELAFVVIVALGISLVESIFVLPGHLANPKVLKPIEPTSVYGRVRDLIDRYIKVFRDKIYIPVLEFFIHYKFLALAGVTALFIITMGLLLGGKIPYTFFPQTPSDIFTIDLALKPGTNENITRQKLIWLEEKVWEVNNELMKQNGDTFSYVSHVQTNVGRAFNSTETGSSAGLLRVFLNPLDGTQMSDEILKKAIAEKVGKIKEAYKFGVGASNRFGAPVAISLMGYDLNELEAAKEEFKDELEKLPSLYNIMDNSQLGSQEIHLTLKPEAFAKGLTYSSLMSQVRQAFYGGLAQRIQEGKDEIWIYVRYPIENRESIGQLENMMIHTASGDFPLKTLASLTKERSLSTINRFNGRREITVSGYLLDQKESVPVLLSYIETELLPPLLKKYPGISYMHQGQQKDTQEQMAGIIKYFGIAFLVIVLIIMVYFRSFKQGFLILIMIPLGILGAIWGHGIHGKPVSMMSLWGIIALSGTIINDAIVFMAKFNQNLVKGMKLIDATIDAGKSRFRAILLTTFTTTAGLMPLILESSNDAQMLIPMAISVAYGILFGTFFILLVLPVLIILFNNVQVKLIKLFTGELVEPESIETAVKNHKIEETLEFNMKKQFD